MMEVLSDTIADCPTSCTRTLLTTMNGSATLVRSSVMTRHVNVHAPAWLQIHSSVSLNPRTDPRKKVRSASTHITTTTN